MGFSEQENLGLHTSGGGATAMDAARPAAASLHTALWYHNEDFFNEEWFLRRGLGLMRCHPKGAKPQKTVEIQNDR